MKYVAAFFISFISVFLLIVFVNYERSLNLKIESDEYMTGKAAERIMAHDYVVFDDSYSIRVAERRAGSPIHGIAKESTDTGALCRVLIKGHVDYRSR